VIWTTTPWTIPANQALNLNPALEYSLVATERGLLLLASALVQRCLERYGLQGRVVATVEGAKLENLRFRHPLYDREAPVYLADYATSTVGDVLSAYSISNSASDEPQSKHQNTGFRPR
jgi:isoleucyl-tRNA synthetase